MGEKIRVLHIITRLIIGGAQENTMLAADHFNNHPDFCDRYAVDVISGPQTGPEGSLQEEIRQRNTKLIIVPELLREISPFNDLRAIFVLRRLIKAGNYDVVHTHSSKAGVLGRLAARLAGVPLIVHTVHGWSFHDQMSPRLRRVYVLLEKVGRWAGHSMIVVAQPDIEKGLAAGIGRSAAEYQVIRSGIELDRFKVSEEKRKKVRAEFQLGVDDLVVGSVIRLSPQKAPLDLIDALVTVGKRYPQTKFLIVGDGPLRPAVEARAAAGGIADRLILTGLRRDVPALLNGMDIFVITSKWEGLPRVLPQAMATRLPIVATEADGSAEAIRSGVNGYLVPRGRSDIVADKISSLIDDRDLRIAMGQAGFDAVPPFGDIEMVRQLDRYYRDLLPTPL